MRFFLVFLVALSVAAQARADIIEVRGKGMMDGEIISEDEETIRFKDNWDGVTTYPKKDVLYMERTEKQPVQKAAPKKKDEKKGAKDSKESSKKGGFSLAGFSLPSREGDAVDVKIDETIEGVRTKFFEFWAGDAEKFQATAQGAVSDTMNAKQGLSGNMTLCVAGMIVMGLGLLGVALFGMQLLFAAFEQGFFWGFVIISNGLAYYAPMFDGFLRLCFYVPQMLTLGFIVRHWNLARSSVVGQLFSLNIMIFGYWMLKASF